MIKNRSTIDFTTAKPNVDVQAKMFKRNVFLIIQKPHHINNVIVIISNFKEIRKKIEMEKDRNKKK